MENSTIQLSSYEYCVVSNAQLSTSSYTNTLFVGSILNVCFGLMAIIGNFLVISAICRTPTLRNPSNALLCCLAFTDLGVGLIAQPSYVACEIAFISNHTKVACTAGMVTDAVGWTLSALSFLTMTIIAVEKLLALYLHLRYRVLVTISRVLKVFALASLIVLLNLLARVWCMDASWCRKTHTLVFYTLASLCLMTILFAYYKILQIVRHHQSQILGQARVLSGEGGQNHVNLIKYNRSVATNLFILSVFFICFVPYICVQSFTRNSTYDSPERTLFHISSILAFLSSSLNPLLLCWRLREVRKAIYDVLKRSFWA